ncbi:MAG: regulatory protein RecX [Dehalococcoidia bacterium]
MAETNSLQGCLNGAYQYLSYRPRSEGEVRDWLRRRGFAKVVVEQAIVKLREQNLSDDFTFAQFWKENRLSFRPKSKRLIGKELIDKKVAAEIIEQVIEDIDDEATAYQLGRNRMWALAHLDYTGFYRRLSGYLAYRGFSYRVIRDTAARLWREKEADA